MSPRRLVPADLLKEIRALLPLWVGCVVVVWMGGYGEPILFRAGFLTYLLGSVALGALSIGHQVHEPHASAPVVVSGQPSPHLCDQGERIAADVAHSRGHGDDKAARAHSGS